MRQQGIQIESLTSNCFKFYSNPLIQIWILWFKLLFTDDLKLSVKSKNQIEFLVQTVHLLSWDIGMQFGIRKCGVLFIERRKVITSNGIRMPEDMKDIDEAGYTYIRSKRKKWKKSLAKSICDG